MTERIGTAAVLLAAISLATGCNIEYAGEPDPMRAKKLFADAQELSREGKLDAALTELAKAVEVDPNLAAAHVAIGDIHRNQGDPQKAAAAYERAVEINPYVARPLYNLGVVYQMLAATAQTYSRSESYLLKAAGAYERATIISPQDFDAYLNLSACHYQLGNYKAAEQYCQQALAIKPDSARGWSNLGFIYDAQNRLYEAVRAYRKSLEYDADQKVVILNLGSTYLRQDRPKAALTQFELIVSKYPELSAAWEQIGLCHIRMRNLDKALDAYEKARRLAPDSAAAWRGVGIAKMSLFLKDQSLKQLHGEAIAAWRRSLELNPNQPKLDRLLQKYSFPQTAPKPE